VSEYIHKSHNVSILLYHLVCPAKYRRVVFTEEVDKELRDVCLEISKRYEIRFLEIGADMDHVHFLVQTVPIRFGLRASHELTSIPIAVSGGMVNVFTAIMIIEVLSLITKLF